MHTPARTQPHTLKTLARALPPPAPAWVPRSSGVPVGGRREEGAAAVPPTDASRSLHPEGQGPGVQTSPL